MLNRGVPGQSVRIKVDREDTCDRDQTSASRVCLCTCTGKNHARTENTGSHIGAHKSISRVGGGSRRALSSIDRYLNEYSSAVRGPLWNQSRRHNGSFRRAPISPADRLSWIQNFTCHVRGLSPSETIVGRGWHEKVVFRLSHVRTRSHTSPHLQSYYQLVMWFSIFQLLIWFFFTS